MKKLALMAALLAPLPALAQPAAPPTKLFTAGADIPGLIAKAKAEHTSDSQNTIEYIGVVPPYRVQLEYRTGLTVPTVHHGEGELVEVLEGSASLATGGTLVAGKPMRPGATTDAGTAIEGATAQKIGKGDYVLIPPDTAHQFRDIHGPFVIMSVHLIMPPAK